MSLILVDENIAAAEQCFGQFGEVRRFAGRNLRRDDIGAAEALIVRSVTRVDEALLGGSKVKFVGSTTIGTDHLDKAWLQQRGIHWCSAPGSNADSVVDYCLSAFCRLDGVLERILDGARVGIIGYGNVGSRLATRLQALGANCLAYDPFLDAGQCPVKAELEDVLQCDIVSLHTPLSRDGAYPSWHMLGLEQLSRLPDQAVLLNAGRGEVLDNEMLHALCRSRPDVQLVLDVWENEPAIDRELLQQCRFGTPHIAGYSIDGKLRGLQMVAQQYADFRGVPLADYPLPEAAAAPLQLELDADMSDAGLLRSAVLACYDIREDDQRLRALINEEGFAAGFDRLRKQYPPRRELSACVVSEGERLPAVQRRLLSALGVLVYG